MPSCKQKKIGRTENPSGKRVGRKEESNSFYGKHPSWKFEYRDELRWSFNAERAGEYFWGEILPRLISFEGMTWQNILGNCNNENHFISCTKLHKEAINRIADKHIEAESVVSLRITGTHRIYGYIREDGICHILWFDDDHGDNDRCICRSKLKHT